ncbi:TM2 domain-containing protein [Candidatus Mycoplasma pogonae]
MKKTKYIFNDEEIKAELEKAKSLQQQGIIKQSILNDYWCKSKSTYKYTTNLLLALFLWFIAADRIYLKKWISAIVKFLCVTVLPLILILIWTQTNFAQENFVDMVMYSVISGILFFGFVIGDIAIAIIKPKDKQDLCIKKVE